MAVTERDPHTGYLTTGHEWNGIKELNTPVPRAVYFFLITTALFSVIYWLLFPAFPLGWTYTKGLGVYGTDYMKRAVVAAFGWPANVERDAVYPYTEVDSDGQKLNGANKYTLTFPKGQTPPVNGFWSITMYEIDKGWWFVPNPLSKFTVSARNDLQYNADGSLTLYFQHQSPGKDKEANWLPAPQGDFLPMMRMYWPKEGNPSILDGSWTPPQIVRVN